MRSAVAGKARVHELAKELGVESKSVLAKLQEMGEFVKSASSTVEAPVARRLRAVYQAGSAVSTGESTVSPDPLRPQAPVKPASAHDIEVAAAEVRAAALKAEQEAQVKAVRKAAEQRDTVGQEPLTGSATSGAETPGAQVGRGDPGALRGPARRREGV